MSSAPDSPTMSPRDRTDGVLIGLAIIVLGLALMPVQTRWAYNFQLIEYDRYFWTTMVMVFLGTIAAAEAVWRLVWRRPCNYSPLLGWVATIASYNVFYPVANGALDRNTAKQRVYVVERRYCYSGKAGLARISLRPVATPQSGTISLGVSVSYCQDLQDGQELYVHVKPGFFGSPWVSHYDVMQNVEMEVEPD